MRGRADKPPNVWPKGNSTIVSWGLAVCLCSSLSSGSSQNCVHSGWMHSLSQPKGETCTHSGFGFNRLTVNHTGLGGRQAWYILIYHISSLSFSFLICNGTNNSPYFIWLFRESSALMHKTCWEPCLLLVGTQRCSATRGHEGHCHHLLVCCNHHSYTSPGVATYNFISNT